MPARNTAQVSTNPFIRLVEHRISEDGHDFLSRRTPLELLPEYCERRRRRNARHFILDRERHERARARNRECSKRQILQRPVRNNQQSLSLQLRGDWPKQHIAQSRSRIRILSVSLA